MSIGDYYASTAALLPVLALTKTASRAVTTRYQRVPSEMPSETAESPTPPKEQRRYESHFYWVIHGLTFLTAAAGVLLALYGAYTESDFWGTVVGVVGLVAATLVCLLIGVWHEERERQNKNRSTR
jgi:hypothetical protein